MNVHKSTQQPLIFGCNSSTMNSLLFAGGNVGQRCLQILLDSGAALSVIRNDALDDRSRKSLTATSKTAIGANGLPLKVMGQVNIDVSLGTFQAAHTFIVVKDLTFECILGVDFLRSNKAVMDFRTNTLHLGNESVMVPTQEETSNNNKSSITVHALIGGHRDPGTFRTCGCCYFKGGVLYSSRTRVCNRFSGFVG